MVGLVLVELVLVGLVLALALIDFAFLKLRIKGQDWLRFRGAQWLRFRGTQWLRFRGTKWFHRPSIANAVNEKIWHGSVWVVGFNVFAEKTITTVQPAGVQHIVDHDW
jgi:hypothetical protein